MLKSSFVSSSFFSNTVNKGMFYQNSNRFFGFCSEVSGTALDLTALLQFRVGLDLPRLALQREDFFLFTKYSHLSGRFFSSNQKLKSPFLFAWIERGFFCLPFQKEFEMNVTNL